MRKLVLIALLLVGVLSVQVQEQVALKSQGPADLLLDHLTEIETDIRVEQFEHQQLYDSQHQECSGEIFARQQAISDGEDALRRAEAHHVRCESSYHEAEADLAQVITYQTQIQANLQQLKITRDTEKQEFQTLIEDELDPAIRAVEGAFPIIDEFANGATSFAQVSKHMGVTFKHLVRSGKGGAMAGVLTAVVQLGSGKFAAADLAEVRRLFENLLQDLINAKTHAIETEAQRQEVYDSTVTEFNTILTRLESTQNELTEYSSEMQACLVEEEAIIDQASSKVRNNKQALGYALEMCQAFEREYENASQGRKAELELLAKLKEFIHEQAEIFGEYGAESSGVFESYQSQYEGTIGSFLQTRQEKSRLHREQMKKALPKKSLKNKK